MLQELRRAVFPMSNAPNADQATPAIDWLEPHHFYARLSSQKGARFASPLATQAGSNRCFWLVKALNLTKALLRCDRRGEKR